LSAHWHGCERGHVDASDLPPLAADAALHQDGRAYHRGRNPGFYRRPERIEQLVDFMVARALDHMNIEHALLPRWGMGSDGEA